MEIPVTRRAAIGVPTPDRRSRMHPVPTIERGRVLIVDDDPAVRLLCAVNLSVAGMRVLEAADGLEGLEQARCGQPDLVLTDVRMPGLDGFRLAAKLRRDKRTRQIPLIFLSGEVARANVERAQALGALAYVTKPFDPLALAALVTEALDNRRSVMRRRSDATRISP